METFALEVRTEAEYTPAELAAVVEGFLGGTAQVTPASPAAVPGSPCGHEPDSVCGLALADPVPDGWTPLEALVAVRCLTDPEDQAGSPGVRLHWSPTSGLPSWEAAGMCDYLRHQIFLCWGQAVLVPGEEEDGDGEAAA